MVPPLTCGVWGKNLWAGLTPIAWHVLIHSWTPWTPQLHNARVLYWKTGIQRNRWNITAWNHIQDHGHARWEELANGSGSTMVWTDATKRAYTSKVSWTLCQVRKVLDAGSMYVFSRDRRRLIVANSVAVLCQKELWNYWKHYLLSIHLSGRLLLRHWSFHISWVSHLIQAHRQSKIQEFATHVLWIGSLMVTNMYQ